MSSPRWVPPTDPQRISQRSALCAVPWWRWWWWWWWWASRSEHRCLPACLPACLTSGERGRAGEAVPHRTAPCLQALLLGAVLRRSGAWGVCVCLGALGGGIYDDLCCGRCVHHMHHSLWLHAARQPCNHHPCCHKLTFLSYKLTYLSYKLTFLSSIPVVCP